MITNNSSLYSIKIAAEIGREIIFFPIWWYGRGFWFFLSLIWGFGKSAEKKLAWFSWASNFSRPLPNNPGMLSRISHLAWGLTQVLGRGFGLLFLAVVSVVLALVWVTLPLYTFFQLLYQLKLV